MTCRTHNALHHRDKGGVFLTGGTFEFLFCRVIRRLLVNMRLAGYQVHSALPPDGGVFPSCWIQSVTRL